MTYQALSPFDSIENAQDYLRLLGEELSRVLGDVDVDSASASQSGFTRRLDALHLVSYKLQTLQRHIHASSRLLNDLRMLERILCCQVQETRSQTRSSRILETGDVIDEFGI